MALWHQAITWTDVDNELRAISEKIPQPSITKISLKIIAILLKYPRGQWVKPLIFS